MALSATVALSTSTGTVNQQVQVTLVISNASASTINIKSIVPQVMVNADGDSVGISALIAPVTLNPNPLPVPGLGSVTVVFPVTFMADSGGGTLGVSAAITGDNGEIIYPTASNLTEAPESIG